MKTKSTGDESWMVLLAREVLNWRGLVMYSQYGCQMGVSWAPASPTYLLSPPKALPSILFMAMLKARVCRWSWFARRSTS